MARPQVSKQGARLEIAQSTMQYMKDGIRHVCENFKKRLPGTQSERDAQAFFSKELAGYSDNVVMQDFTLHPRAFMGWIPIAMTLTLASVGLFLFNRGNIWLAALGALLPLMALLMALFEFLFYREFVDFLFPKRVSRNVYATRRPSGEVKRRIIFGGHTDAANEWYLSYLGGKTLLAIGIAGGIAAVLVTLVAGIVNFIHTASADQIASRWEGGWLVWTILLLVMLLPMGLMFFFVNYRQVCDGANDNLSANYIAMAVIKEMHDSDIRFDHTEVACFLSGSEEAGLRGARAFAKANMEMLADPNVETVFIALDTMREVEELRVCHFGCTGTVKNDPAAGELIHQAARACGIEMPGTELYPGAIDAEAFSRLGLTASGFTGVSHEARRYYHSREDTADNLDDDCLALSLNICKEAARMFDENGLPEVKK